MSEKEKAPERKRRDWIIILIILLIGFLCVILAGGWAIRFSPTWRMDTDMGSNIDPDSVFLTSRPSDFLQPLDPSILTQPVWINVFLTPSASFLTSAPVTPLPTNTPLATNTAIPTTIISPTTTGIIPSPTNTVIYFPPPPTNTLKPPSTNTPVPPALSADLSITKSDGVTSVNAGSNTTYTVRVTNNGPDTVTGAILTDLAATGLTKTVIACSPTPGQCAAPPTIALLEGGSFALPTLTNGQFYEITITANVTATGGSVTNTAAVTVPAGVTDSTPGNNSVDDNNTVNQSADLSITITDYSTSFSASEMKIYEIVVSNLGPSNVTGATVSNAFSNGNATSIGWVCLPLAICTNPLGTGNINETVNLNSGASVTFYLTAQVIAAPSGNLVNTATVSSAIDPNSANNTAVDIDYGTTYGNIGTGQDGSYENLNEGDSIILSLSSEIDGTHPGPELIYYERDAGGFIYMDWIILEISNDASTWYTILNWGDGSNNPGTNINSVTAPPNSKDCTAEADNCNIDSSLLVNNAGITIDIDGLVPSGTYSYIRISVPVGGNDPGVAIDGIYVVP